MRDINTRIEDTISRRILWFVVNMPSFPSSRATRTLRNLLNLLKEARADKTRRLVQKDCGGAQHAQ